MKRALFSGIILWVMLGASRSPCAYNLYEIKSWYIQANEGFSPKWYPDGVTRSGKQKYSIACGYNDWGTSERRWKIAKYLKNGLSYMEGIEISIEELASYKTKQSDPYVDLAFRLHMFNTGSCKSIKDLRGCCGATFGCGSGSTNTRLSHNPRRKFEYALATHDFITVNVMLSDFRKRAAMIRSRHK